MTRTFIPEEILTAAHERAAARAAADWATADRLRGEIEAAGWRVVDTGTDFRLEPAHAPDVVEAGRVRYGRSEAVPSRADEPATGVATVVIVASDDVPAIERAVAALRDTAPPGTSAVIVADGLDDGSVAALEALAGQGAEPPAVEVIATSAPLGRAAAWNIGLRRATGPVILLLDGAIEPTGDIVTPLVAALDDPMIALAGPFGLASEDLRQFREVDAGPAPAIEGYLMAFRRSDAIPRGPLDERFRFQRNLDIWWSLVLRDEGEDRPPRRAVVVPNLPFVRHPDRVDSTRPADRDRLAKRNFYRVLDRFGHRADLADPGTSEIRRDGP